MRDEHTIICSPAMFELIAPDAPVVPVKVELTYSSRDPYAVQASFRTGHSSAVDWVFARDLLADGLLGPAGTGDVRVQPVPHDPGRIELELTSPSGHAVFTTCAATLADFLDRTFEAVPPTTEYSWLDFDEALSGLLDNDRARD
ncbi:SsgA family sporulation/cell division regulator [Pseudonocardia acidicola]|uniref:SsgA family sporulation/cell division regulator n=1 Tax=Pseudonocardia acidicola TaxID=2724939 RepID=A0ABX1SKC9_9PSEU|nr:SsgA family sporulation/cell division regulator [Pseudonocardia acidicola]NMI00847.1 SsgA family sporulation/cell division regulator [Pseudonocardia acidicola]